MLLPQTDTEQAVTLCRRVRSQYEGELAPLGLEIGVTLDFGVAVHPQVGDQKSALMGLADKRLYELKHSDRVPSRVTPLEPQRVREREPAPGAPPPIPPPPRSAAPAVPGPSVVPSPVQQGEHRKWERVSLAGTKAHGILTEGSQKTAKVIDLSYGGVALLFDKAEDLPAQFNAVLHVPILPPVRVVLRKVHTLRIDGGRTRVSCSFVS